MREAAAWWSVIAVALRRCAEVEPRHRPALVRRAQRIEADLLRTGAGAGHITPELAAWMIGISPNRMRRLCHERGGVVGYRITRGRWGVFPAWIADEIARRNVPCGDAAARTFAHFSVASRPLPTSPGYPA